MGLFEHCFWAYSETSQDGHPSGHEKWPSYRGGRLMKVISLKILRVVSHLGSEKVAVLTGGRLIGDRGVLVGFTVFERCFWAYLSAVYELI